MSARLKLKKLKLQMKFIRDNCKLREAEALHEVLRCHKLLRENTIEVEALVEFYPMQTTRDAVDIFNYNVCKITDAIVRKYTERLSEYVRDKLTSEDMFNRFTTFGVRMLAPALTEDHVKVYIKERI